MSWSLAAEALWESWLEVLIASENNSSKDGNSDDTFRATGMCEETKDSRFYRLLITAFMTNYCLETDSYCLMTVNDAIEAGMTGKFHNHR